MKEIVFAGSGGQGVLTAGLIISDIAATEGINVTWVPSYGSAMRGGTANCTVKYCENTIYNPSQEQPDLLLAMNSPSFHKFLPLVAPGGVVVIGDLVEVFLSAHIMQHGVGLLRPAIVRHIIIKKTAPHFGIPFHILIIIAIECSYISCQAAPVIQAQVLASSVPKSGAHH